MRVKFHKHRLPHAHQASIANQVLLQIRAEGALTSQPGKSSFGFLTQMNLRSLDLAFLGWPGAFDFDFDQVGPRSASGACLGIHAAGRNQFGLGELVRRKDFEDGGKVLIGKLVGVTTEQAANITTGETAAAGDVALVELPPLGLALEGNAEVAHWLVDEGWLRVDGSANSAALFFLPDRSHYTQHFGTGNK